MSWLTVCTAGDLLQLRLLFLQVFFTIISLCYDSVAPIVKSRHINWEFCMPECMSGGGLHAVTWRHKHRITSRHSTLRLRRATTHLCTAVITSLRWVCVRMRTSAASHTRGARARVWVCLYVNCSSRVWMAASKYRMFQLLHPPPAPQTLQ